jgi:hypothetical protein
VEQDSGGTDSFIATHRLDCQFGKVVKENFAAVQKRIAFTFGKPARRHDSRSPTGKTGIEFPPARSYGTVFSGAGDVAGEAVGWGCSGMAGAVMGITGKVSVCTVAGSSRSFR